MVMTDSIPFLIYSDRSLYYTCSDYVLQALSFLDDALLVLTEATAEGADSLVVADCHNRMG